MLKIWNKPCPVQTGVPYIMRTSLLVGLFVALFLFFFQPFGIHAVPTQNQYPILAGYGLITSCVMLLYGGSLSMYMRQHPERESQWTVKRQIVYVLLQISTIAGANFYYSAAIGMIPFSLEGLLFFIGVTFAVGLFPTITLTLYGYTHYLKTHIAIAEATNLQLEHRPDPATPEAGTRTLQLTGENKTEAIDLDLKRLLFIAAAGNYAELHLRKDKKEQKILLRSSLSRLEDQLQGEPDIARCHRSYLVNLEQVVHVSGNAQGYLLHLRESELTVPVGRSFARKILDKIGR
ncbi:response regulator receiver protein [Flammeovirgaceae bacterium 311]|nr:response regulator receiver protein [Flammeovirgaceae bacterium 311]